MDGLVHVSQLADRFVKGPHDVVKAGDVVRVRVTEVDVPRQRIGLTMRTDNCEEPSKSARTAATPKSNRAAPSTAAPKSAPDSQGALGSALAEALKRQVKTTGRTSTKS